MKDPGWNRDLHMTRDEFLSSPDVVAMMTWVASRFDASSNWSHSLIDRRTQRPWSCNSLFDASLRYSWKEQSWRDTKRELDRYRDRLRTGVRSNDDVVVFDACEATLRWGGVWANNGAYLTKRRDVLLDELRSMSSVLLSDRTPVKTDLLRDAADPSSEMRMNAGFVKIYSLLLDYCVIYDGRVGAALGMLARQFCEDTSRVAVPAALAFAYGSPKEGRSPTSPKRRDPSTEKYSFPRLRGDSRFHAEQTMMANWFLRGALMLNPSAFSPGEAGFHELAAGLFMIGYDLSGCSPIPPR